MLDIDSIRLFNIARYTASMPLLPSALPPKGEARRYVANDFLNLVALPKGGKQVAATLILTTFVCQLKVLLIEIRNTGD